MAYVKAGQHIPNADHIMMAYRLSSLEGSCDDSKHYGGLQILKTLKKKALKDIAVFVACTKGETNLGGCRFKAIQDVVQESLQLLAYQPDQPVDHSWTPPEVTWSEEEGDDSDKTIPMETAPMEERLCTPSAIPRIDQSSAEQQDIIGVTSESENIVS